MTTTIQISEGETVCFLFIWPKYIRPRKQTRAYCIKYLYENFTVRENKSKVKLYTEKKNENSEPNVWFEQSE